MKKIRKGDLVVVLTGKDKGRTGIIKEMVGEDRAIVDGINVVKKHMRPNPMRQNPGGIVDKEMSIHVSNLAIFDSEKNRATRVGIKTLEDSRKVRVTKVSGTELTV
jgi:large subunit ribosomal protein L24